MPWRQGPMKDVDRDETFTGSCEQAMIREYPNGATHADHICVSHTESIGVWKGTGGTETSKYPEEKKSTEIPSVVASESGSSPNQASVSSSGVAVTAL